MSTTSVGGNGRSHSSTSRPRWDRIRRELWFGPTLVKCFRVPATNQQLILDAFAEEDWPEHLDDPLPPIKGVKSAERLHAAINRLNGRHLVRLFRFKGDGTGSGILWERLTDSLQDAVAP